MLLLDEQRYIDRDEQIMLLKFPIIPFLAIAILICPPKIILLSEARYKVFRCSILAGTNVCEIKYQDTLIEQSPQIS